jgi:hypothetical protein
MRKYIVMAGGQAARWDNYLGVPKHLTIIDGEKLIERTVRMLLQRAEQDITILSPKIYDSRYQVEGAIYRPTTGLDDCFWEMFTDLTESNDTYVLLGGDVWYSDACMDEIMRPFSQYRWVGQLMPNFRTGQMHEEIWAIMFEPAYRSLLSETLDDEKKKSPHPTAWNVYRVLKEKKPDIFTIVSDETCDMDCPHDYTNWMKKCHSAIFA